MRVSGCKDLGWISLMIGSVVITDGGSLVDSDGAETCVGVSMAGSILGWVYS